MTQYTLRTEPELCGSTFHFPRSESSYSRENEITSRS